MNFRHIIDESGWKPYETTYDMTRDFHERFEPWARVVCNYMPFIWVENKETGHRSLITHFGERHVGLFGDEAIPLPILMRDYTYLDGTPIGTKE